jgi:dihydrofolate reductase
MCPETRNLSHNRPAPIGSPGESPRAAPIVSPLVSLIVAMTPASVIGRDNDLPWRLPADLARFKALTMGHPIIMGRRTWDSIGRPLPGRTSIVLSRSAGFAPAGAIVVPDFEQALVAAGAVDEVFVIGGAQVYALALPRADRLYLSIVHADIDGDAHFPAFEPADWREVERIERPADERHAWPMTFSVLERAAAAVAPR